MNDVGILHGRTEMGTLPEMLINERARRKKERLKQFKSIFYFPIDCQFTKQHVYGLDAFDLLVTYTEFGRSSIKSADPLISKKIRVVPHGTNTFDFMTPYSDREAIRQNYFLDYGNSRFIISNINRNQARKAIPETIFGFLEAKENWPSDLPPQPLLYLHMAENDPEGWDLRLLLSQTGLTEQTASFTEGDFKILDKDANIPTKMLAAIYGASDVYLTTTTGEGWGLTVTEAMAAAVPVICPIHTSLNEISGGGSRVWALDTLYKTASTAGSIIRWMPDYYQVSDKIIEVAKCAETEQYYNKIGSAHNYVEFNLQWGNIAIQWADIFRETYGTNKI
jgi:glycosyltransferase involved in cell wall biosynthesis